MRYSTIYDKKKLTSQTKQSKIFIQNFSQGWLMTSRYGAHGEGRVGINVSNNRVVSWGSDSLVKTWPNGISGDPNQVNIYSLGYLKNSLKISKIKWSTMGKNLNIKIYTIKTYPTLPNISQNESRLGLHCQIGSANGTTRPRFLGKICIFWRLYAVGTVNLTDKIG